jgi:hypothetical protein
MRWDEEGRIRCPTTGREHGRWRLAQLKSVDQKSRNRDMNANRNETSGRVVVEARTHDPQVRVWKGWLSTQLGSLRRLEPRRQTSSFACLDWIKIQAARIFVPGPGLGP